MYVQRRIAERAGDAGALIAAPNARVFVCGDGAGMAKEVHAALAAPRASTAREAEGDGDASRGDDQGGEGTCATSGLEGGERRGSTRRVYASFHYPKHRGSDRDVT